MFEGLIEITDFLRSQFGDSLVLVIKAGDDGLHINAITFIEKDDKPLQIGVDCLFIKGDELPNVRAWAKVLASQIDSEIEKALAPGANP